MIAPSIDHRQVRRRFSRAAATYERHDAVPREVQTLLEERLDFYLETPACVIDAGAGTGRGAARLSERYRQARVIAIDFALPLLREANKHNSQRRPFQRVCADVRALPLPDHSVDVLYANLCFHWVNDLPALFAECARVLKPNGLLAFATSGPDTLKELREAWAGVDPHPHVNCFPSLPELGEAMLRAGLRDPVLEATRYTLTYREPRLLLQELHGLGATYAATERTRHLLGKHHYHRMVAAYEALRVDGRIPATWEVITTHAWGVPPGRARRLAEGGETASFPIDHLRRSLCTLKGIMSSSAPSP